jgi:outer membrane receptor protein involved in Fe transport
VALRSRFLDRQAMVNLNLFYLDWEDKQVAVFQGTGLPNATENAGAAHSLGAELEVAYRPQEVPGLYLSGSAGVLETEYDDYRVNATTDYSGNEFPAAPQYTIAVAAGYRHASGAFASAEVLRQAAAYDAAINNGERKVFGYNTINARVGYAWELLELAVFGTNLSDEFGYVRNQSAFYAVPNSPRVLGVSLDARW